MQNTIELRAAVERALNEIRAGKEAAGIENETLAELSRTCEYSACLTTDNRQVRLFSTVHHDTDLVYESPLSAFDLDRATELLASDVEAGIDQFDRLFPG